MPAFQAHKPSLIDLHAPYGNGGASVRFEHPRDREIGKKMGRAVSSRGKCSLLACFMFHVSIHAEADAGRGLQASKFRADSLKPLRSGFSHANRIVRKVQKYSISPQRIRTKQRKRDKLNVSVPLSPYCNFRIPRGTIYPGSHRVLYSTVLHALRSSVCSFVRGERLEQAEGTTSQDESCTNFIMVKDVGESLGYE